MKITTQWHFGDGSHGLKWHHDTGQFIREWPLGITQVSFLDVNGDTQTVTVDR